VGRKALFRCPVRTRCRGLRAFSESFLTAFQEVRGRPPSCCAAHTALAYITFPRTGVWCKHTGLCLVEKWPDLRRSSLCKATTTADAPYANRASRCRREGMLPAPRRRGPDSLVGADDAFAFSALYDRHSRAAYSLAHRVTGNAHDAEDIVQ
jgi:Sigma-70 region 2